jgi:3-oxoadipate enol-lactonase
MTRHTVRVGSRAISYLDTAPGESDRQALRPPTLVLLHAFPLMAEMWAPQLRTMPGDWRALAPDLAGFGESDDREPVVSLDDYAKDVLGMLDALGIRDAVIGGLSMGGYTALALFRLAPGRFRGIVLADTRAESDTPQGRLSRQALLARLDVGGPAAVADEMAPKLLGPTTQRRQPALEAHIRQRILANRPSGIANAIRRMMARSDSTEVLARITCPALVMVGEEDVLTPPDAARAMHRPIPGATLTLIPGAGHLSNVEQPEAFNEALHGFLRTIPG